MYIHPYYHYKKIAVITKWQTHTRIRLKLLTLKTFVCTRKSEASNLLTRLTFHPNIKCFSIRTWYRSRVIVCLSFLYVCKITKTGSQQDSKYRSTSLIVLKRFVCKLNWRQMMELASHFFGNYDKLLRNELCTNSSMLHRVNVLSSYYNLFTKNNETCTGRFNT